MFEASLCCGQSVKKTVVCHGSNRRENRCAWMDRNLPSLPTNVGTVSGLWGLEEHPP